MTEVKNELTAPAPVRRTLRGFVKQMLSPIAKIRRSSTLEGSGYKSPASSPMEMDIHIRPAGHPDIPEQFFIPEGANALVAWVKMPNGSYIVGMPMFSHDIDVYLPSPHVMHPLAKGLVSLAGQMGRYGQVKGLEPVRVVHDPKTGHPLVFCRHCNIETDATRTCSNCGWFPE